MSTEVSHSMARGVEGIALEYNVSKCIRRRKAVSLVQP